MKRRGRLSKTQIIALGFLTIVFLGTVLLMLPASSRDGESAGLLTAAFTAVSSSCVTGLVLADTYVQWSLLGKIVILVLIQIGGLGFMTIAARFFLVLNRKLGLKGREILSESISTDHIGGIMKLTKRIVKYTALFEGVGALLLMLRFCRQFGFWSGLFAAVFHSVSAFCNAGFDVLGRLEPYCSLSPYYNDVLVNVVIMILIVAGGLGFAVWNDFSEHRLKLGRYRLHSKIVLSTTAILLFGGAILFFILEKDASAAGMSTGERMLTSVFDSVTARTAGFNTVDIAAMSSSGRLVMMVLMFIGGSSGSTAGGIKTTSIAVLLLYAVSYVRGKKHFGVFGRRLEDDALRKAAAVFFTNLSLALAATVIICARTGIGLSDVLFEAFSAIGTVGLTAGITRSLDTVSCVAIMLLMFCGRVGSLSFATALVQREPEPAVKDPVERIVIG